MAVVSCHTAGRAGITNSAEIRGSGEVVKIGVALTHMDCLAMPLLDMALPSRTRSYTKHRCGLRMLKTQHGSIPNVKLIFIAIP